MKTLKKLDLSFLSQLCVRGIRYQPDMNFPGGAGINLAVDTESHRLTGTRPRIEIGFSGFIALESNSEILAMLDAAAGQLGCFGMSGIGTISLSSGMFSAAPEDLACAAINAETTAMPSKEEMTILGQTISKLLAECMQFQTPTVFMLMTDSGQFTEGEILIGFALVAKVSVEAWQKTFELKAQELTAATMYHSRRVGQAEEVTSKDIAVSRVLN